MNNDRYQHCVINPRLRCYPRLNDHCPYGTRWLEIVTLWATTLDGHSVDLSSESTPDFRSQEVSMIRKAEIARLLRHPEEVAHYCQSGEFSHTVCLDLIRSNFLWQETKKGFTVMSGLKQWFKTKREVLDDWKRAKAV